MKNNLVLIILIIMLFLPICTLSECYPTFVPDNTTAGLYYWTGCNEVEEDIATDGTTVQEQRSGKPLKIQDFLLYEFFHATFVKGQPT